MIIRFSSTMLLVTGVILFTLEQLDPWFSLFDWVGVFSMIGGFLILLIAFPFSDTGKLYDTLPPGTCCIPFIRRDNSIVPVIGKRVFPGESFLEVKQAGIIEDLGVDTVLLWGRKKIRFALENLNYTPDPRFFNVSRELYRLGFDDEHEMKTILFDLPNMDPVKERAKKAYYMDRMAQIYWNLTHSPPRGGERFVSLLKTYKTKDGRFGPPRSRQERRQAYLDKKQAQTQEKQVTTKTQNYTDDMARLDQLIKKQENK